MIKKLGDLTLRDFAQIKNECKKSLSVGYKGKFSCEICPLKNSHCRWYSLSKMLTNNLNKNVEIEVK